MTTGRDAGTGTRGPREPANRITLDDLRRSETDLWRYELPLGPAGRSVTSATPQPDIATLQIRIQRRIALRSYRTGAFQARACISIANLPARQLELNTFTAVTDRVPTVLTVDNGETGIRSRGQASHLPREAFNRFPVFQSLHRRCGRRRALQDAPIADKLRRAALNGRPPA